MKALGIDLGSREVKIIIIDQSGKIHYKKNISTMRFYKDYCDYDNKIQVNIEKLGIETNAFDIGISTGYGRNNTDLLGFKAINEIKAHAYGAMHQSNEKNLILLDVGGQDVKIMRVEKGIITDIELNDKCAASCGRYLENMASVLEVELDELAQYYENPVELNSTCAVFSESELIGKIAEGVSLDTLCASVNNSLYKRLKHMLLRFPSDIIMLSGGVAKGLAIKKLIEQDYPQVYTLDDPQHNGAIGCAVYGLKILSKKEKDECIS